MGPGSGTPQHTANKTSVGEICVFSRYCNWESRSIYSVVSRSTEYHAILFDRFMLIVHHVSHAGPIN